MKPRERVAGPLLSEVSFFPSFAGGGPALPRPGQVEAGPLSQETRARIPPDLVELFARYAGAVTGNEVEGMVAMFKRGEVAAGREVVPAPAPDPQDQLWERVKERLRGQMSPAAFLTRVKNTQVLDRQGNRFTIAAPDPLSRDWLANRFADLIRRALTGEVGEEDIELEFVV